MGAREAAKAEGYGGGFSPRCNAWSFRRRRPGISDEPPEFTAETQRHGEIRREIAEADSSVPLCFRGENSELSFGNGENGRYHTKPRSSRRRSFQTSSCLVGIPRARRSSCLERRSALGSTRATWSSEVGGVAAGRAGWAAPSLPFDHRPWPRCAAGLTGTAAPSASIRAGGK